MILPSSYFVTLALMIFTMLCWGSWANTYKLTNKWRFELYYFDYSLGVLLVAILAAFTVGTLGFDGFSFRDDVLHAGKRQDVYAFMAGVIFNLANMLLVAAISLAGMAVAFPIAIGLALVIGVVWSYALAPQGSPLMLFAGAGLVLISVVLNSRAYKIYKLSGLDELVRTGQVKSTRKKVSTKGVVVSLVSGVLMGCFYPLVERAKEGDAGLGPYSAAVIFAVGVFFSTFLFNLFFMNLPISGGPLEILEYFQGSLREHFLGLAGGVIWGAGTIASYVAASAEGPAKVGPAASYGVGQCALLVSTLWGLLLWKEFKNPPAKVKAMLAMMFALCLIGVVMISTASLVNR